MSETARPSAPASPLAKTLQMALRHPLSADASQEQVARPDGVEPQSGMARLLAPAFQLGMVLQGPSHPLVL